MLQNHINLGKFKVKNEFARNILTLLTGTTVAQALPVVISPVLTRIYSPSDFGIFSLFVAITSIVSTVATGKYELALMSTKDEKEVIQLFYLSLLILIFSTLSISIIIVFFNENLTIWLGNTEIRNWLYFVPVSVFLIGISNLLIYFNNRYKNFKEISKSNIYKAIAMSIVQVVLGFISLIKGGLIIGQLVAYFIGNRKLYLPVRKYFNKVNLNNIKYLAKKYNKYPKYEVASGLLNTASIYLGTILLSKFFDLGIVGFFSFALRLISLPTGLIGSSIGQVYFQKLSEIYHNKSESKQFTQKIYKLLINIGITPFLILTFFGDIVFKIVFGSNWATAGLFTQMLSPWLFLVFITSPITSIIYISSLQRVNFIFNISIFLLRIIGIIFTALIFSDAEITVFIYGVISFISWLVWNTYILSKVGITSRENLKFIYKLLFLNIFILSIIRLWYESYVS